MACCHTKRNEIGVSKMKQSELKSTKQPVHLSDLLKEEKPIWVRNTSKSVHQKRISCEVVLQINFDNNERERIIIPSGNAPYCLSDQADHVSLKKCRDLLKLLSKGYLELLDPNDLDKPFEEPVVVPDPVNTVLDNTLKTSNNLQNINSVAKNICMKLSYNNIVEEIAVRELQENSASFSLDDFEYIIIHGKHKVIKNWAKDQISKLLSKCQ